MASLHEILSQRLPNFRTRQALIVLGLQNDFISPDGKLPVRTDREYLARIRRLVPAFRDHGVIIWVKSEYRADRGVNDRSGQDCTVILTSPSEGTPGDSDPSSAHQSHTSYGSAIEPPLSTHEDPLRASSRTIDILQRAEIRTTHQEIGETDVVNPHVDSELFLTQTPDKPACCIAGSTGAEYTPEVHGLDAPDDIRITKTYYSAFKDTGLLNTLRIKLITEIYFVGNMTNLSVYASAVDAAQHGLSINIVEDCLGYRSIARHQEAINQLVEQMGASITSSTTLLSRLRGDDSDERPPTPDAPDTT